MDKNRGKQALTEPAKRVLPEGKACPGQGKRRFETGMNARILHIMRQRICGSEHGCRFMW